MRNLVYNQFVRIIAWNGTLPNNDRGASFGTCLTALDMNPGATEAVKLRPIDTGNNDQIFKLIPAQPSGFRIVHYKSGYCLDAGDIWREPNGQLYPNMHALIFRPVDLKSTTQIFRQAPQSGYAALDGARFLCTIQGVDYSTYGNDWPAKDWVLIKLMTYAANTMLGDLYVVEPAQLDTRVKVKFTNKTQLTVSFSVAWNGGKSRELSTDKGESRTLELDGINPPLGTSCWAVANKTHGSADNFTISLAKNDPYVEYTFVQEGIMKQGFRCQVYG